MLRPTESKIIFLQQLGRGLRTSAQKSHLVAVNFIGNHRSFLSKDHILTISENTENGTEKTQTAPKMTEFFNAGFDIKKVNKQHGNWFNLVASQEQDDALLQECAQAYTDFLFESVQSTSMTKSFKMILLEAFIALDGFRTPPTQEALAEKSWHQLADYPYLKATELPTKESKLQATDKGWLSYWKNNPIKALAKDTKAKKAWFKVENNLFTPAFEVHDQHIDKLTEMMQELINYKLTDYANREKVKQAKRQYEANLAHYAIENNEAKLVAEKTNNYN